MIQKWINALQPNPRAMSILRAQAARQRLTKHILERSVLEVTPKRPIHHRHEILELEEVAPKHVGITQHSCPVGLAKTRNSGISQSCHHCFAGGSVLAVHRMI